MDNKDKNAFPLPDLDEMHPRTAEQFVSARGGMTKLEYACITLGVPQTGDPDLDAVIREGERRRVAAMMLNGILCSPATNDGDVLADGALYALDALIAALDTQEGE